MPNSNRFGPLGVPKNPDDFITMTVEEYETIRLIDLEGFMQEECATQMGVARTTVQRIYNDARTKIAQSIVKGRVLVISGGDYKLCEGLEKSCGCGGCQRHRFGERGE